MNTRAYQYVIRAPFQNNRIKIQFENMSDLRMQVIEQAIRMIPGVDKSFRPFINPFNGIVEFSHRSEALPQVVLIAMRDNIRCICTYSRFVDGIEGL